MSDLKTRLQHAASTPTTGPDVEAARHRATGERRRRLGLVVGSAAAALVVIIGVAVAQVGGDGTHATVHATSDGRVTATGPAGAVSFDLPAGWRRAGTSLTPNLANPQELTTLGTFAMQPSDHTCAQYPVNALEAMTDTDALIWVSEWYKTAQIPSQPAPPRPAVIGPDTGTDALIGEVPDCLRHPLAGSARIINFAENGRQFILLVAIGTNVSPERRAEVYTILNSMKVD